MAVSTVSNLQWECDTCHTKVNEDSIPDEWIWVMFTQDDPAHVKTHNMYHHLICNRCNWKMLELLNLSSGAIWKFLKDQ